MPPLIEREAQERVARYRQLAADERQDRRRARRPPAGGLVRRAAWSRPTSRRAPPLLREEMFGPLLTVERVPGIEAALEIVDSLPFALTGGLFSRSPQTIEQVAAGMPVGNLYVNRAITGAMVGRQPFGGNRRSGIGSKAGGPGLPAPVHRAAGGDREHDAPRARHRARGRLTLSLPPRRAARRARSSPCARRRRAAG